jgi:indolepyruvate decarboxylase
MTGPELAQAPRYGLRPIVILMNNGGWGIFRPIAGKQEDLLTIPNWPYAELARLWGGAGYVAETIGEFRDALADAERAKTFALIETRVGSHDLSPVSRKYIEASARKGHMPSGRALRET